jgi:hypothetical protein
MLELNLRSGHVVAFDGRIVEVFLNGEPSRRFHIAQLRGPDTLEAVDGGRTLAFGDTSFDVPFAREEAPACARLVAAIDEARAALERLEPS